MCICVCGGGFHLSQGNGVIAWQVAVVCSGGWLGNRGIGVDRYDNANVFIFNLYDVAYIFLHFKHIYC